MDSNTKIAFGVFIAAIVTLSVACGSLYLQNNSLTLQNMTYISDQASKRDDPSIFITANNYTIQQNSSNNLYEAILNVSGVIINNGPTICQITQLSLNITLHMTSSMRKYFNSTEYSPSLSYSDTVLNGTFNSLGWNSNQMFIGIECNNTFSITMPIANLDNRDPNLQSSDIQGSIFLQYNDASGMLTENQPIIAEWLPISS